MTEKIQYATPEFSSLAPTAPARCLTRDLMTAECKWADLNAGPTTNLAFQVRLMSEIADCDDFDTLYIRIGEPGQPGYFIDEEPNQAMLADALVGTRGCNIASVTWAGVWDIDNDSYGEKRAFSSAASMTAEDGEGAGELKPLGPIPVIVQRRRIADSVYEQVWVTKIAFPRATRDYLAHVLQDPEDIAAVEKSLADRVNILALNLM